MSDDIDLGDLQELHVPVVGMEQNEAKRDCFSSDRLFGNEELAFDVGRNSPDQLRIPRSVFGHMHIRGMTGSGKTSLALIPLIRQFMAPYGRAGSQTRDPIVVIDLGGDQNLFHNVAEHAAREDRTFRAFFLDPDLDTHHFPPLQAVPAGEQNIIRTCQMLVQAFHMDHGLVYGGQYFTQQNMGALLRVARELASEEEQPELSDIARYLEDPKNHRKFRDADQVRMTIAFLLEYKQLREAGSTDKEILMERAIDDSEVIYFFCPTLSESVTSRLVAGLGLFTLLAAAMNRSKLGNPKRQTRVFIDEFQEIAGTSFAALMAQSRKFGFSLILANQSTSQLEHRDVALSDIVFEGTQVKQYFSCVGKHDTEVLQSLSNERVCSLSGSSVNGLSVTSSEHQIIRPSLEGNTIRAVSDSFGLSFVLVNDGAGHREPAIVRKEHDYEELGDRAMPMLEATAASGNGAAVRTRPRASRAVKGGDRARRRREAAVVAVIEARQRLVRCEGEVVGDGS